jgi:hypothetical protein
LATFGRSPLECFPLLAPPPLHASTHRAGKAPFVNTRNKQFIARCSDCLRVRYCESCHKWWCEDCYELPDIPPNTKELLGSSKGRAEQDIKVHMGLCIENCLAPSMMAGAGSNGMWG